MKVVKKRKGVRVPDGWHVPNVEEARARRTEILSQMRKWDIAELAGGEIAGPGYGGVINISVRTYGLLVLFKNDISLSQEAGGNIFTVEPPLVEIDQPARTWSPPSRNWGPAPNDSQPDFKPTAPQEKGESEITLKPPSYNDALAM